MATLVSIDGELFPPESARVSVFDRGFLFGDSVFETIRTYGGAPFALGEHLERLEQSAGKVHIHVPVDIDTLRGEIERTVRQAGNAESYIRVVLTRGTGAIGLDPALATHGTRVVIVSELSPPPPADYREGIRVVTFRAQRPADSVEASGAKIGNYLVSVLGMREARLAGAQEALIVDGAGRVVEGASSNVFWVSDGQLYTPPIDAGILAGITRRHLIGVARRLGIVVETRTPTVDELCDADEVFISSSIREMLPVVAVDERVVGTGHPGELTRRLHAAFAAAVRASST